jgi:hypothetical protein
MVTPLGAATIHEDIIVGPFAPLQPHKVLHVEAFV